MTLAAVKSLGPSFEPSRNLYVVSRTKQARRTLRTEFPAVQPLSVFAARLKSFEVLVRHTGAPQEALALIFNTLPLADNGWHFDNTEIEKVGARYGFPIWKISRC